MRRYWKNQFIVKAVVAIDRITNPGRQQVATFGESDLSSLVGRIINLAEDNAAAFNIKDKRLLSILKVDDVTKTTDPDTGEPHAAAADDFEAEIGAGGYWRLA